MSLLDAAAPAEEITLVLASPGLATIEVPVWVVVVDDAVIVRSYTGVNARWYRRAVRHPSQSIRIANDVYAVDFSTDSERMPPAASIDDAYDDKYARFDYVNAMSKPLAAAATLVLVSR